MMRICASVASLLGLLPGVAHSGDHPAPAVVHRRTEFAFALNAPYEKVAPLFGADKERLWAEHWSPQFLHPQPANDESGAVFTVKAGHPNVWINTIYDLEQGHVQYACFVAEAMVTLIDIHLRKLTPDSTGAEVAYERTAVRPEANDEVNRLAEHDRAKGAEWEAALRTYLHVGEGVSVNHD